jgi:hypothetical protein
LPCAGEELDLNPVLLIFSQALPLSHLSSNLKYLPSKFSHLSSRLSHLSSKLSHLSSHAILITIEDVGCGDSLQLLLKICKIGYDLSRADGYMLFRMLLVF